jgi:NAD(P)H-flavin reductase
MTVDPMLTRPFRVEKVRKELSDTFTMDLVPEAGGDFRFAPGQFNMLYVFGVGEVPISISGDPNEQSKLTHTTRAVGAVSQAITGLKPGDAVGVRGPFGTPWPVEAAFGNDLVIVAGGVGLAPLRPAIYSALANRKKFGRVVILYGARTPVDILFRKEVEQWRGRFDIDVDVTVDRADSDWVGNVGVVTKLIERARFDAQNTTAFVCGPEVMMKFCIQSFAKRGVETDQIYVSMERNMKCGIGFCGHCQFGSGFVCKDGPVYRFDRIADIFAIREL